MHAATRSIHPCAMLATVAGALVLAAITALSLDVVPPLPAQIILGISLTTFYGAAVGAMRPASRLGDDPWPPSDVECMRAWRNARLLALGVPERVALVLADDPSFSVHELKRLLAQGCPLDIALRILWPD